MSEMVERVAKAMAATGVFDADFEAHLKVARAAIEAMREPTEDMIKVCSVLGPTDHVVQQNKAYIVRDWAAMIDAALKD